MKKTITTAILYTLITAVVLGIGYPLAITGLAHVLFPKQAAGELITRNGEVIGSHLIGQAFTGPTYFHSRPSAGTGYDAGASSGSNLASTSKALIDRTNASIITEQTGTTPVPIDLVTASASGLDPDISPAAALYQVPRVATERHLSQSALTQLVQQHTTPRQFGLLGEPRVNVLDLNLALDNITNR
jgi:K+-transporting ATPase ATPase C chain